MRKEARCLCRLSSRRSYFGNNPIRFSGSQNQDASGKWGRRGDSTMRMDERKKKVRRDDGGKGGLKRGRQGFLSSYKTIATGNENYDDETNLRC